MSVSGGDPIPEPFPFFHVADEPALITRRRPRVGMILRTSVRNPAGDQTEVGNAKSRIAFRVSDRRTQEFASTRLLRLSTAVELLREADPIGGAKLLFCLINKL